MMYFNQFLATQLTSYEGKQTEYGIRRTWGTQWAPTSILTHHIAAFTKHGFTIKSMAPTPGTTTHTTVTWDATELRQKTLNTMLGHTKCKDLKNQFNQPPVKKDNIPPRQDMHLTNEQQHGSWHAPADFNSSLVKTIRDHTHIDPNDMHPDWDTPPTGKYTVHVGLQGPEHPSPVNRDTAYIYSPAGRTMGTITTDRLEWLYQTYTTIQNTHPEEHAKLGATYFAADLAALLIRYMAVENSKQKQPHSPSIHPALAKAISLIGTTQERFASPLDHSPLISTYWSKFEQDQIFGAQRDAYTRP